MSNIFCCSCGKEMAEGTLSCPHCGVPAEKKKQSNKDFITTLLLCFFLGGFGVHRFYVGKVGTGLLQLFTFGGFGVWAIIDLVTICCGKFKDKSGNYIKSN